MKRADPKDGDVTAVDSRDDDLMAWNMERLVALASMMEADAMVIVKKIGMKSGMSVVAVGSIIPERFILSLKYILIRALKNRREYRHSTMTKKTASSCRHLRTKRFIRRSPAVVIDDQARNYRK